MTCKKAQGFLEAQALTVVEQTDAGKVKQGRTEALALAHTADKIVVVKGKKVVTFDLKTEPPSDDALAAHLIGPTGNLRAPTLRCGNTLLVGFSEEAYRELFPARHSERE